MPRRRGTVGIQSIYNTLTEPDAASCYLCRLDIPHNIPEHRTAVREGLSKHKHVAARFDWSKPGTRERYHKEQYEKAKVRASK